MTRRPSAAHALLAAAALAGCFAEPPPPEVYAVGTDGLYAFGFAYQGARSVADGPAVQGFQGYVWLHARNDTNVGEAVATGFLGNQTWTILFNRFAEAPGKPYQDGGVAADLEEHGDSGVGDASIPRVRVRLAAWGEAEVVVDSKPLKDPVTNASTWAAHFMLVETGVRDDGDGAIYASAAKGDRYYDPAKPAEGYADPNDAEIHLVLRPHEPPPQNGTRVQAASSMFINNLQYQTTVRLANVTFPGSTANLTFAARGGPETAFNFTVLDPRGREVGSVNLVPESAMEDVRAERTLPMATPGLYQLRVTGGGLLARWNVTGTVHPPADIVHNFWWEQVETATTALPTPPAADDEAAAGGGSGGTG